VGSRIINPLNWSTPIVDAQGRPTLEFQKKWEQQARANTHIPIDAAAVSALLDKLGAPSGLAGSLLRRGASEWATLGTPGGTAKFLRADGTYATPPNTTYGVVSTTANGLAPELPDDATQYLDGTGAWSTPAGGGGAVSGLIGAPIGAMNGNDTGAFASLTNAFILLQDITIDQLFGSANVAAANVTYSMCVLKVDSSGTILGTVATAASRFTTSASGFQTLVFDLAAPVTLTAGMLYAVALVVTSGTGTTACRASSGGAGPGYGPPVPLDFGAMISTWATATKRFWYTQNSDAPTGGSAAGNSTSSTQYGLGFRFTM
jgi:hypothetical protein